MADLAVIFPREIEVGASADLDYNTRVVTADSGWEVRNGPWATPLRTYEFNVPVSKRTGSAYQRIIAIYEAALGCLYTFRFTDWKDESGATIITVRFDCKLRTVGIDRRLEQIESVRLVEVRE